MLKKPLGFLLSGLLVGLLGTSPIQASEPADTAANAGEVLIDLSPYQNEPVLEADFRLIQIAADSQNGPKLCEPFEMEDKDFQNLKNQSLSSASQKRIASSLEEQWLRILGSDQEDRIDARDPDTNAGSQILFSGLSRGIYLLTSKSSPYFRPYQPVLISIPTNGSDEEQAFSLTAKMTPKRELPEVEIHKVDENGQLITGRTFTFKVYADEACTSELTELKGKTESGKTSRFVFDQYRTIYLQESKAPNGYQLSDQVVEVEFDKDGLSVDGKLVVPDEDGNVIHIRYTNKKTDRDQPGKPNAGSDPDPDPYTPTQRIPKKPNTSAETGGEYFSFLFGASIVGLSFLVILARKNRRKEVHEKN